MKRIRYSSLIIIAGLLFLTGCSGNKDADPIQSLEKATISPEREILFEATRQAYDGSAPAVTLSENVSPTNNEFRELTTGQETEGAIGNPSWTDAGNSDLSAWTPSIPEIYALQPGETAKCIARRFGIDWVTLYSVNNISFENENNLPAGTMLNIPGDMLWNEAYGPRATAAHPTSYTVRQGDTFYTIACSFGDVYPEAIAQANNLNFNEAPLPGLNLQIP